MNDNILLFEYFGEQINKSFAGIVHADQGAIRLWIEKNKTDVNKPKCRNYMNADSLNQFIYEMKKHVTQNHYKVL